MWSHLPRSWSPAGHKTGTQTCHHPCFTHPHTGVAVLWDAFVHFVRPGALAHTRADLARDVVGDGRVVLEAVGCQRCTRLGAVQQEGRPAGRQAGRLCGWRVGGAATQWEAAGRKRPARQPQTGAAFPCSPPLAPHCLPCQLPASPAPHLNPTILSAGMPVALTSQVRAPTTSSAEGLPTCVIVCVAISLPFRYRDCTAAGTVSARGSRSRAPSGGQLPGKQNSLCPKARQTKANGRLADATTLLASSAVLTHS